MSPFVTYTMLRHFLKTCTLWREKGRSAHPTGASAREEYNMESVFSEIFSFRVPGGEVFMQRRFELSPDWAGGLKSLPIVSDRSTSDTLFVLPADAMLLFRAGALTLPAGGTYSVQFHGSGKYFDTPAEALAYMAERWPVPFSLWRQKLDAGENVLQQSQRRAAAFAEGFPGLTSFNEALASQIGA